MKLQQDKLYKITTNNHSYILKMIYIGEKIIIKFSDHDHQRWSVKYHIILSDNQGMQNIVVKNYMDIENPWPQMKIEEL